MDEPGALTKADRPWQGVLVWMARRVARVTRHIRFPGREKCLRAMFPPKLFVRVKRREETVRYDEGLRMRCDPSSIIEWQVFFKGYYDYSMVKALRLLLRSGNYAVDVGANVGAYTLIMANSVADGGRVAAFEPNPEVYKRLLANLDLNRLSGRVETYPIALSSQPGTARLHLPSAESRHRGIASLVKYSHLQESTIDVPVRTLESVIGNWGRCDLIKIDTDGNDYEVLRGGLNVIMRFRPNLIFEYSAVSWPEPIERCQAVHALLDELEYKLYWIDPYWAKLRPIRELPFPEGNIAALRAGTSPPPR